MIKIKKNKLVGIIAASVIITLLVTVGGFFLYTQVAGVALITRNDYDTMNKITEKYSKLYEIQNTINEDGLWEVDENTQMEAIYNGLFSSLNDEYSSYMNEETLKSWNEMLNGSFSGVGINFTLNEKNEFEVLNIIDDSPASSSGIVKGDILLSIDGKKFENSTEMANAIRGKEGSRVKITYSHNGKEKSVSLVRGVIKEQTVYSKILDGNIGYLGITAFEKGTGDEFITELSEMEKKKVKGIVIDLRNNGGGYTDEGIKIVDALLPEGTITYMEDKKGEKTYYNSDENSTKLRYVLLVNSNTASTSEIMAAAIKDNKGGSIVGETTFGKGIVQATYDLKDGTAMKLTVMQYFSPNGDKIHGKGVTPDYEIKLKSDAKTDTQLEKACSLL